MALVDTIQDLVEEELEGTSYFLVEIIGGDRSRKIQVLIDGDDGINIDQCSKISRAISEVVDEEDFEADPFILEVSSPGADMPLINKRQYKKHIGRKLEVETTDEVKRVIKLSEVTNESISGELVVEGKKKKKDKKKEVIAISFDDIIKSTVVLSFK